MDVFILDAATLEKIGVVDQSYSSLRWTRRLYAPDSFEMIINRRRLYASELRTKRLLYLPSEGELCFFIEQTGVRFEGSRSGDQVKVRGRSMEGPALAKRRVVPPAGQSHDRQTSVNAETAMKHYVDAHAGPGAVAARRIPNLIIAADQARGSLVTVEARHQPGVDILREIGLADGMGWGITFDPTAAKYVFDVIAGVDRTASVFFDPAFETLEAWEELDSIADSDTVAIVGGQGEGVDRQIVTRWRGGVEPTGFDRREVFIDARDVELGNTAVLNHRGDAHLEATAPQLRYEAKVHHFGSFRYREHWDLGDLILLRNEARGISQSARVIEVESIVDRSSGAPERTAVLDRPFPTLKERMTGGGVGGSVQDRPVTLPPDPHAASHAEGGADEVTPAIHGLFGASHALGGAIRARVGPDRSIGNANDTTVIYDTITSEDDEQGDFILDTATGILTINNAGWYEVVAGALWASNATGLRRLEIWHGLTVIANDVRTAVSGALTGQTVATKFEFAAGATTRAVVHQTSGGALLLVGADPTFFAVHRIR